MAIDKSARTRVGVFDSGVGGLSVLQAIARRLPQAVLSYCSDNDFHPYGTKPDAMVADRTLAVCQEFVRRSNLDILVVACNTASTVALSSLRSHLSVPVVGVVPAIKPAAGATRSGIIGLLATPATVKRPYVDDLVEQFAKNCRVVRVGSSALVSIAESKARGGSVDIAAVKKEISDLFVTSDSSDRVDVTAARLDTVVLGCTHFPLIVDELEAAAPWHVAWLDSGEAVATRVVQLVAELSLNASSEVPLAEAADESVAWVTRIDAETTALHSIFARFGLTTVASLPVVP